MALALSLVEQKLADRERYRVLSDLATNKTIAGMTMAQVKELENLHQAKKNDELEEGLSEEKLRGLVKKRVDETQERLDTGQPPFETTFFKWTWDNKEKVCHLKESKKPITLSGEARDWQPELVTRILREKESTLPNPDISRV